VATRRTMTCRDLEKFLAPVMEKLVHDFNSVFGLGKGAPFQIGLLQTLCANPSTATGLPKPNMFTDRRPQTIAPSRDGSATHCTIESRREYETRAGSQLPGKVSLE
jgi:hypothetical protein